MNELYEWIRNITYYLIFMTVVSNLLPNRKYEKYFKLFAGMVLILLVLKPLTGSLRLDDKLAYYFEAISFQKEAKELEAELSGMEGKRLQSMINQYETAVEYDVTSMAEAAGFACKWVEAVIDGEEESPLFGHVVSLRLLLAPNAYEDGAEIAGPDIDTQKEMEPVKRVEPVEVEMEIKTAEARESSEVLRGERSRQQEENKKVTGLKRRIAEYYDLEEEDIEIQLEDGEG